MNVTGVQPVSRSAALDAGQQRVRSRVFRHAAQRDCDCERDDRAIADPAATESGRHCSKVLLPLLLLLLPKLLFRELLPKLLREFEEEFEPERLERELPRLCAIASSRFRPRPDLALRRFASPPRRKL